MKVSLNWLRDFLDLDKSPSEIADILTSLGLEVEGWETVRPSPVDLDKVFTGKVLECERIPETDHLSATKVDVGDGVARSIVCGAPNVAAGQKVLVALPGANVFSKDGQLFQIGERKVKGVPSQGMICAKTNSALARTTAASWYCPPTHRSASQPPPTSKKNPTQSSKSASRPTAPTRRIISAWLWICELGYEYMKIPLSRYLHLTN